MTEDNLPYIGKMSGTKNIFVTTGYTKWGMTTSFVSAKIITDLIIGKDNVWAEMYSPERTYKNIFIQFKLRFLTGMSKLVTNKIKSMDFLDLKPEQGKVFSSAGQKIAVYKDIDGNAHTYSAVCTHLGCTVGWNKDDKTWDCPCHGSRFNKDGKVINGPAIKPLPKIKI